MQQVKGEDGQPDFVVSLGELCRWTGYSDGRLLQLAREGVVIRQSRGRYVLRASVRNVIQRARERAPVLTIQDLCIDL